MDISPAQIIKDYGLSVVHRASGIPIGTLARWAANNSIPGEKGTLHMKQAQLLSGLQKLIAEGIPKKASKPRSPKKRKAA